MILDVEGAFKDYFVTNMVNIVGNGNFTVTIYKEKFPVNSDREGISIFAEIPSTHPAFEIFPCGVRINTKAKKKTHAFALMQNVDLLIDKRANTNLNSEINLCKCLRNSGPSHFEDDSAHYYTALYETEVRKTSG